MAFKVAARLRRHAFVAETYFVGLRVDQEWIGDHYRSAGPTDDTQQLFGFCRRMLAEHWSGQGVHQVQITATDPRAAGVQADMFATDPPHRRERNRIMDAINEKYGEFALAPARLLEKSAAPMRSRRRGSLTGIGRRYKIRNNQII